MDVAYLMVTLCPMAGKNQTQEICNNGLELGCGRPYGQGFAMAVKNKTL